MSRLTEKNKNVCDLCGQRNRCIGNDCQLVKLYDKLAHYKDLEEQGRLIDTHKAAVILAETFGYEHPCNFNGIDEWFPEACDCADLCPDGKMSAIACWEQYIKIKLAELKGGVE